MLGGAQARMEPGTQQARNECSLANRTHDEAENYMLSLVLSEGALWGVSDTAMGGKMVGEPYTAT